MSRPDPATVLFVPARVANNRGLGAAGLPPGTDKLRELYPKIDWTRQLEYGEEIGLGSRR